MRIRRLSAVFWTTCILAFLFILYVVTDLSFKLPSIRPAPVEIDDIKWSNFESKLRHIEEELNQHHAVVDEIKSAVDQMMVQPEYHPPQVRPKKAHLKIESHDSKHWEPKIREFKAVGDEPPRMRVKFNTSTCPLHLQNTPKTDIQMLSMYERITFDDKDGGVWKQGWNIEYNEDQWNSKNKLKVFIVPHSHNDPGWIKTFENYYKTQTRAIFTNMVEKLAAVGRKFIWAETSYLALWWTSDATDKEKAAFRSLLKSGKIEIVTGGWVMNDEANSHWLSIIQQLTTGHQWLLENLSYLPRNGWSIDPFGYSSAQPYLLKLAGIENTVIQRVHYRIKKELALNRQLEFKWRQLWDGVGKTDLFTHMMPFYSYDVPHTCGPDPKVCCQFDFKRLPGNGVTCPWGIPPKKIINKNVEERTSLILDQWRKKAQLYRSSVLLVPLGDDFRYDRANEWDNQYGNYEAIADYINAHDRFNAQIQFGTLQDYFKAVHEETKMSEFPVLSGDFFTYADRNQHYWSGYYTSRPFYKNMDRILLAYVRAAETISVQAQATISRVASVQLRDTVEAARRALSLFQHHDGVTGTARDDVTHDYGNKMLTAIKHCQSAIQQAAYQLLQRPPLLEQSQPDVFLDVDDVWRQHDQLPERINIALDAVSPSRRIVFYNALVFKRREVVTIYVSSPHVEVFDPEGNPMMAQVSPVVTGETRLGFAANKFQLSFPIDVEALALVTYTVSLRDAMAINKYTSYSRVRVYNADYLSVDLPKMFAVEQASGRLTEDITLQTTNTTTTTSTASTRIVATEHGLIKAIVTPQGKTIPLHMDFVQYSSQKSSDNNSGAYLFIPEGNSRPLPSTPFPEIVACEGPYRATLYTALHYERAADILFTINVYNTPGEEEAAVDITNTLMMDPQADDVEVAMQFDTSIQNGDNFYTDLNGMQMIKRRYMEKLPLQANFYPLPAAAFIQDDLTRLTILTSTPLGFSALRPGQIQIMQDRRLSRDDNRGLNQGVLDNVRTRHNFRLLFEHSKPCQRPAVDLPTGFLSVRGHVCMHSLLQPLLPLHYSPRDSTPYTQNTRNTRRTIHMPDVTLAAARAHATSLITISDIVEVGGGGALSSSLTFNRVGAPIKGNTLTLCPMEVKSAFLPLEH
ncbi:unnamed protein product [Diatraea saccharalis]|uniref:Alpha-mannosidase n=1 Tax=Diatraea saccharalis TaxID=40085 RepID=A0A9N9WEW1_9NEOP|nr:unnamed protein product [Diatraea saccharalis]